MRPKRSSRKLWSSTKNLLAFIVLFSVTIAALLVAHKQFLVRQINIVSPEEPKDIRGIEIARNQNLLFISPQKIAQHLLKSNPQLQTAIVRKRYPQSIEIEVQFAKEAVQLESSSGYLILDKEGKILRMASEKSKRLPVMRYYQKFQNALFTPGEKISYKDIVFALDLLEFLKDLGHFPNTIDISSLSMIAFNLGEEEIVFTTEKNSKVQRHQVEVIIQQLKIKGQEFKRLDVRFDKPIITFK